MINKNSVDGIYAFIIKNILIYPDLIDELLDIAGLIDDSATEIVPEGWDKNTDLYWDEWFSDEFSPTRPIGKELGNVRSRHRCKGLRKTKEPKCGDQSHCVWKKAKDNGKYKCFNEVDDIHMYT